MLFVRSACPPISFVIKIVFRPCRLAYKAADKPGDAPPIIIISFFSNESEANDMDIFYSNLFIIARS